MGDIWLWGARDLEATGGDTEASAQRHTPRRTRGLRGAQAQPAQHSPLLAPPLPSPGKGPMSHQRYESVRLTVGTGSWLLRPLLVPPEPLVL